MYSQLEKSNLSQSLKEGKGSEAEEDRTEH